MGPAQMVLGMLVGIALLACSAIVSELDVGCADDCAALNKAEHLEGACFVYQCREDKKGCEKGPLDHDRDGHADPGSCADAGLEGELDCDDDADARAPGIEESCDGIDNDCDMVIDEHVLGSAAAPPDAVSDVSLGTGLVHVGASSPGDGRLTLTFSYRRGDEGELTWWREDTPAPLAMDTRCPLPNGFFQACRFEEVALASSARGTLALGVNTAGCGAGQVRVGASFDTISAVSWNLARSSQALSGIDPDPARPACSDLAGAAEVSVALLDDHAGLPLHAVGFWRDRRNEDTDTAAPLRGIALALEAGAEARTPRVQATQAGVSEVLSLAPGYDPAAVVAWPAAAGRGYILAYTALNAVALAFLPASGAALEPLLGQLRRGESIDADSPRAVALAFDAKASAPDSLALAAAWRASAAGRTTIGFSTISFAPTRDPVLRPEPVLTLEASGDVVQGPLLIYQREGFTTGKTGAPGGWYVIWLERLHDVERLMAARVAQAQTQPLEPPFVLHEETAAVQHLFAYSNQASPLGYGFTVGTPQPDLYIGSLACPRFYRARMRASDP